MKVVLTASALTAGGRRRRRSFLTLTSRGSLQILHVHPPILFVAREHVKSGIGIHHLLRDRLGIIRPSPLG